MKARFIIPSILLLMYTAQARAVTVQGPGDVHSGFPYLYVEAETAILNGSESTGFLEVSKTDPIDSVGGLPILPEDSNVSGTALLDQIGGGNHTDTATLEVQFSQAGTYYLYVRESMYDATGNGNYSNEDSFFLPPAFNLNSQSDWVGFTGLADDGAGGFVETTFDSENDGWFATRDWGVRSAGVVEQHNNASEDFWNGQFHWYFRPTTVDAGPGGGFLDDFGFKIQYIVTEADLNQTLTFEIGTREPYVVLDGFLFSTNETLLDDFTQEDVTAAVFGPGLRCDINGDNAADAADAGIMFSNWGTNGQGDCSADNIVDAADAGILFSEWTGDPTAADGQAAGEYNIGTGEIKVHANNVVNWYIQSTSGGLTGTPVGDLPGPGLVTDNNSRVGETALGKFSYEANLGNVAVAGLPQGDLVIYWNSDLGRPLQSAPVAYVPEPASLIACGLGLLGLSLARRRA